MLISVVEIVVDPQAHGEIGILGGRGNQHLPGAGFQVLAGPGPIDEKSGRFEHHLGTQVAPAQPGRIALRGGLDPVTVDGDGFVVVADLGIEYALRGVVFEEMRKGLVVGQIVDSHDLLEFAFFHEATEDHSTDSSESIDCIVCHSSVRLKPLILGRGN